MFIERPIDQQRLAKASKDGRKLESQVELILSNEEDAPMILAMDRAVCSSVGQGAEYTEQETSHGHQRFVIVHTNAPK